MPELTLFPTHGLDSEAAPGPPARGSITDGCCITKRPITRRLAEIPPPEAAPQPQVAQRARPPGAANRDPRRPSRDAPRLTSDLVAHPS